MSMTFAEQFESIKNQKTLMVGLLFLLVIVVFWIGLSMFGSQTKFAVSKEMRDLAKPLTPTLKESSLTRIEQKRQLNPSELEGFTIYKIIEDKSLGGSGVRVVDISYELPEEGLSYGSLPTPRQGGLSNYLQANPGFDAAPTPETKTEESTQTPGSNLPQPSDQPTDQPANAPEPSPQPSPKVVVPTEANPVLSPSPQSEPSPTVTPSAQ